MTPFHDVAKVFLDNTRLNYFDMKSLLCTDKHMYDIVSRETYKVDQSIYHKMYVSIIGHFLNVFPGKAKNEHETMGIRIVVKGLFVSNLTGMYEYIAEDKLVIGMAQNINKPPVYYFGNNDTYKRASHVEFATTHAEILNMIYKLDNIQWFDIMFCNVEETSFYDFLSKFLQVINYNMSVNLTETNILPENVLLFN